MFDRVRARNRGPTRALRRTRTVNSVVFALHGAVFAAWTPHIPLVRQRLGMDVSTLGLTLLGGSIGSTAAMLFAGAVVARFGSRSVVLVSSWGYVGAACLLGLAASPWQLFGALLLTGGLAGFMDVAMNTQGVLLQRRYGRPILSGFHAWWSMGTFVGTGLGALSIGLGVDLAYQMAALAVIVAAVSWPLTRALLDDTEPDQGHGVAVPWRNTRLLVLGGLIFAALLCEGAAGDWSAVYLRDALGASPVFAGLGYAAFSVAMFTGRVMGDRWVDRFGGARTLATLAVVGALGMAIMLVVGHPVVALVGFAALGLGLACMVPVVFSAAASSTDAHAGRAIAGVATAGWSGFLVGPPLIGFLAHAGTLPLALGLLPALCVAMAFGARVVR